MYRWGGGGRGEVGMLLYLAIHQLIHLSQSYLCPLWWCYIQPFQPRVSHISLPPTIPLVLYAVIPPQNWLHVSPLPGIILSHSTPELAASPLLPLLHSAIPHQSYSHLCPPLSCYTQLRAGGISALLYDVILSCSTPELAASWCQASPEASIC